MFDDARNEDTTPFLETGSSPTSWRAQAKDPNRRGLIRKIALAVALLAFCVPLFLFFQYTRSASATLASPQRLETTTILPSTTHHDFIISTSTSATEPSSTPVVNTTLSTDGSSHPVTFSLIMFSEDSAAEGAVLIKSIMMHSSVPLEFHFICDEVARQYLEKRLNLVHRPLHDVLVRFYQIPFHDMQARIRREGGIATDHSAGVPGLMKLFIHEILPDTVKRAIFVDTDAFFISDPLLLWEQFNNHKEDTAVSMPTHPEQSAPEWHDASKICSCVILLNLERLRKLHLMDSTVYRDAGITALSPPGFRDMFGPPGEDGHYQGVKLGDQGYWWAIVSSRPDIFEHLSFDWEVSSCLVGSYGTALGHDDANEDDELSVQIHTWATPHQGEVILPKLLHFNCLDGTERYYDWSGWSDKNNDLNRAWGPAVAYYAGAKWLWLNQGSNDATRLTMETVHDVVFADQRFALESLSSPSS